MTEHVTTDLNATAGELRVVLGQLMRRLREQTAGDGLTRSQLSVLGRIERGGPTTATVLARAEGIRPQSMAPIVGALEAAGLIAGEADPSDGRKTVFGLTDQAREHIRTGRIAREDWLAQAMAELLSPAEIDQLTGSVDLLRRLTRY